MSKQSTKMVYVVGYDPINDMAGVGGFDWYYNRLKAMNRLQECLENEGDTHLIWFRTHKVNATSDLESDQRNITTNISDNIVDNGIEGNWV